MPLEGENQGVERVSAILHAFRMAERGGLRLIDVATYTGLNKSTVFRLLRALVGVRLLEHDEETGLFYLGFDLFLLGSVASARFGILEMGREHLMRLSARTHDTVYLSARSGLEAVCIDRCVGSFPIKVLTLGIGDRRPLGVGAGSLAILASLPDEEVDSIVEANSIQFQRFKSFSRSKMFEMVLESRRNGFAFNDGRIIPQMSAVAVPVIGRNDRPIAALSVAALTERMKPRRRDTIVRWLKTEAKMLSGRLKDLTNGMPDPMMHKLLSKEADD